jgi:hypothetical protein
MGRAARRKRQHASDTLVAQLMGSRPAVELLSLVPVPLFVVRSVLIRDNARENRRDSWQRLRGVHEAARYRAVRSVTERYAANGFVLDVGCSQGILQEGCGTADISASTTSNNPLRLHNPKAIRGPSSSALTDRASSPTRYRTLW